MPMDNFRIANCNAANFNYPGVRYAGRAGSDGAPLPQASYDHKVKWLSGLMDTAMVDLVGFQELFHKRAIADVVRATKRFSDASVYAPDLEASGGVVDFLPESAADAFCLRGGAPEIVAQLLGVLRSAPATTGPPVIRAKFRSCSK